MKTLRRHEPAAIRSFSHVQIFRRKMRRASCISTIWWGVTVSCSSSHLTCHFDLNLTGVGSRCRSDASFVLITDMSRLAVKMRRKYTCAAFESFRFPILLPLWKYKELLHMGGACMMFGEIFIGRTKGRTSKKTEHQNWQNLIWTNCKTKNLTHMQKHQTIYNLTHMQKNGWSHMFGWHVLHHNNNNNNDMHLLMASVKWK